MSYILGFVSKKSNNALTEEYGGDLLIELSRMDSNEEYVEHLIINKRGTKWDTPTTNVTYNFNGTDYYGLKDEVYVELSFNLIEDKYNFRFADIEGNVFACKFNNKTIPLDKNIIDVVTSISETNLVCKSLIIHKKP